MKQMIVGVHQWMRPNIKISSKRFNIPDRLHMAIWFKYNLEEDCVSPSLTSRFRIKLLHCLQIIIGWIDEEICSASLLFPLQVSLFWWLFHYLGRSSTSRNKYHNLTSIVSVYHGEVTSYAVNSYCLDCNL